jgi:hypothetical protein
MKTIIDLRPVYHRTEDRIRAHVLLCWLALLIRIAETTCDDTWLNFSCTRATPQLRNSGRSFLDLRSASIDPGHERGRILNPTGCSTGLLQGGCF